MRSSKGDTKETKTFLMSELQDLEKMKAALEGTSKEDHKVMLENFVMSLFAKVDKEERTDATITK